MDHFENKHCIETPWSNRYHYIRKDGNVTACGVQDSPTLATVYPTGNKYPSFDFELPRQGHDLEKLESMLHRAYMKGCADQKQAIGKMMRDLIGL